MSRRMFSNGNLVEYSFSSSENDIDELPENEEELSAPIATSTLQSDDSNEISFLHLGCSSPLRLTRIEEPP